MDAKAALRGQYLAGLAMLRDCIEKCPNDLWIAGKHPRAFWRIAYHAVFYSHLYLMTGVEAFQPWDKHCPHGRILWDDDEEGDPPTECPFTQSDLVEYVQLVVQNLDLWLDAIDLDSTESGFPWYPIPKLDHQIVNIRHIGVHVGQLQELLYAHDIDTRWVGRG